MTTRFLIVTADDFGRSPSVNAAVATAARDGILTAASLMVAAPCAAEAIALARSQPSLRVGLHLVLTDGHAVLPRSQLPDLVDESGRFRHSMVADSFRMAGSPRVRRQLAAEIRAQFDAFQATGLRLDHVNAHKHFHLHPMVLELMLEIGAQFSLRAVRLPLEPLWMAGRSGPSALAGAMLLRPWLLRMRRRLRARGIACNDRVFGIACSGRLDERTLLAILDRLPAGASEVYLHPDLLPDGASAGYRGDDELRALTSPRVREALAGVDVCLGGFAELPPPAVRPVRSPGT